MAAAGQPKLTPIGDQRVAAPAGHVASDQHLLLMKADRKLPQQRIEEERVIPLVILPLIAGEEDRPKQIEVWVGAQTDGAYEQVIVAWIIRSRDRQVTASQVVVRFAVQLAEPLPQRGPLFHAARRIQRSASN